ncbi:hypothetical protein ABW19_dt0208137 [Dactylella cylindrospora]|nr:hypothetical protein ABW19_dt0208137 [Dactylella cylindrospora]
MAFPLYRCGNSNSARFDNVRQEDIRRDGEYVLPGTGGISVFQQRLHPSTGYEWSITSNQIEAPLILRHDHGQHYLIEPRHRILEMTYVQHLQALNHIAQRLAREEEEPNSNTAIPDVPTHHHKSTRFVVAALTKVYKSRLPIAGWDENDYGYIGNLAIALNSGNTTLQDVVWSGTDDNRDFYVSKMKRMVALAVVEQMKREISEAKETDEDVMADMANDHLLLILALRLEENGNPYTAFLKN